jgi:hypothetical protein
MHMMCHPLQSTVALAVDQYFSKLSPPLWNKTALLSDIPSLPSIRGRNGLIFPAGSGGEHKNGTILFTTEIIPAICGENKKTGQIAGRYFLPLAVFCKGVFFWSDFVSSGT